MNVNEPSVPRRCLNRIVSNLCGSGAIGRVEVCDLSSDGVLRIARRSWPGWMQACLQVRIAPPVGMSSVGIADRPSYEVLDGQHRAEEVAGSLRGRASPKDAPVGL